MSNITELKLKLTSKELKLKIRNKRREYRRTDINKRLRYPEENKGLKTISVAEGIELLDALESSKCPDCDCEMLFDIFSPFCLYMFSYDRIDEKKIHSKDNLRVVCFNCNASGAGAYKNSCSRGCHTSDYIKNNKIDNIIELFRKCTI
jgi:hypothetical protein